MQKLSRREVGLALLRAAILYVTYITLATALSAIFVLLCTGIVRELNIPAEPVLALSALGHVFSIYSLTRAFELYDTATRARFIKKMGEKYSLRRDLCISFGAASLPRALISLGTPILLAFLSPVGLGYGFLMRSLESLAPSSPFLVKGAIVCPVMALLMLLAVTSAHKWWIVARTSERERMDKLRSPNLRLALEVLKIAAIYAISFAALPTVIMLIVSLVLTLGLFSIQPWIIPVIAALIVLPWCIKRISLLSGRRRYYRRLTRALRAKGYTLEQVDHPILSVVRHYHGPTFIMSRGDKRYAVKLLSARGRFRPTYINKEGFITVKRTVSFMRITFFHVMHDYEYTFDSDCMRIAVLTPLPRRLFLNYGRTDTAPDDGDGGTVPTIVTVRSAIMSGGKGSSRGIHGPGYVSDVDRGIIKPFETGETIGGFKFFTPSGFISAADNDCIER